MLDLIGSNISEAAYLLSKTCSSEAYYYINRDAEQPEEDLFVPILLRKSAVAWNISYTIELLHDLKFIDGQCTRDNRIRLRRTLSNRSNSAEKAYFMYDFPAGHARQLGVCIGWEGEASLTGVGDDEPVFKLKVEYTNIRGQRFWQEQTITKEDVIDALQHTGTNHDAAAAACRHRLQLVSADVLHSAADYVKSGDKHKSRAVMQDGQKSLQTLMDEFGANASAETSTSTSANVVRGYAMSVAHNLGALIDAIEKASEGESWNKMKAVSTAICRESPNVSNAVMDDDVLCPLPVVRGTGNNVTRRSPERRVTAEEKKRRVTIGLDSLLEEHLGV